MIEKIAMGLMFLVLGFGLGYGCGHSRGWSEAAELERWMASYKNVGQWEIDKRTGKSKFVYGCKKCE